MSIKYILKETARKILPKPVLNHLKGQLRSSGYYPPVGSVRFGDLRRVSPVTESQSLRGLAVDRYFIEKFLSSNAEDIYGRVMEIKDNYYTRKFGMERVTESDILNYMEGINPESTIIADLASAPHIPSDTFDCIIFTQTLQYIYDSNCALETLYRILKPGGVLLTTVPAISHTPGLKSDMYWYWNFTSTAADRLFKEFFPPDKVEVQSYGNILAALCFLHGIASEELTEEELDHYDPNFEVIISIKSQKPS